jgi:NhaP-type Na+/H+ or K+/H+ antiporter
LSEQILVGLTLILAFGIGAQWVSWRLYLPSILILITFGLLDPDELLGPLLFPVVCLIVMLIRLEGGMSLRLAELKGLGRVVPMLISSGALVTWLTTTVAAMGLLGLQLELALLLGPVLVVTGPTVILPLLRYVRPRGRFGPEVGGDHDRAGGGIEPEGESFSGVAC